MSDEKATDSTRAQESHTHTLPKVFCGEKYSTHYITSYLLKVREWEVEKKTKNY